MPGRKPRIGRRIKKALALTTLGLGVGWASFSVLGQEPIPKLPATKVEGTPTPGQPTEGFPLPPSDFPPQGPAGPGVPVSGGGIFASPASDGYRAPSSTTGIGFDV